MAEGLRKPEPLSFEGNVALNWKNFVQEVEIFITAAYGDKNDTTKAYVFLNLAGREVIEKEKSFVYAPAVLNSDNSVRVPAESCESIAVLKQKFAEICGPHGNVIMERHKFNTRNQKEGEPFQSFVADLKILASTCEYDALRDDLIRDKIVCGVTSSFVRKQLLKERDLTLDRAIEIVIVNELLDKNNSELTNKAAADLKQEVHSVSKGRKTFAKEGSKPDIHNCKNCGGNHTAKQQSCPAFGRKCLHCGKPNHFEKVCHSKRAGRYSSTRQGPNQPRGQRSKRRHHVNEISPEFPIEQDQDDLFLIDPVTGSSKSRHKREIYCTMEINGKQVELKIETGANCNVITLDLFKSLSGGEEIDESKAVQLIAYGGDTSTLGPANFECNLKSRRRNLELHVVDRQATPLLGLPDSSSLNLIQLHSEVHEVDTVDAFRAALLDEYKDLFEGDLGNLPVIYKMRLNPDTTPVGNVSSCLKLKRQQQKASYDQHAKPLSPLRPQQVVRLRTDKGYEKVGIIKQLAAQPRSYIVQAGGEEHRRHCRHILAVPEPGPAQFTTLPQHPPAATNQDATNPEINPSSIQSPSKTPAKSPGPQQSPTKMPVRPQAPDLKPVRPQATLSTTMSHVPVSSGLSHPGVQRPQVITRSGRISRPNPRYQDFVT